MKFRQQAVATAVSLILSSVFLQAPLAVANTTDNTVAMASTPKSDVAPADAVTAVKAAGETAAEVAKQAPVKNASEIAGEKAQEYIRLSKNKLRSKGRVDEFQFAHGVALVSLPSTDSQWADSRVIAMRQAQMKAREKFIKSRGVDITSEILSRQMRSNKGPEFTQADINAINNVVGSGSPSKFDTLLNKVVGLADAKLDQSLQEAGVDPVEYNAAPPEKRKVMMKKAIANTVTTRSKAEISGAPVVKMFEETDTTGRTAVAVVIRTSVKMRQKLSELRASKGNVQPDPVRRGPEPGSFLHANKEKLMYLFGAQVMTDDQGYPMILSFGQAGNDCDVMDPDECLDYRDFSYMEAESNAYAHISELYNLQGTTQRNVTTGQEKQKVKTARLVDGETETAEETVTRILKDIDQSSKLTSSVKGLVGIEEAYRWSVKHAVTGKEVNGVVLAWRPQREQMIRAIKKDKVKTPQAAPKPKQQAAPSAASNESMDLMEFDF